MVQKGPGTTAIAQQKLQAASQLGISYEKISQDPMKHVVTFIEKKIRNLDKRKSKLDGYRRMVEDGKPLDPDQTAAASKYDEVIGSLEFAKDLMKHFEATTIEVMKQQRKTLRREQTAREEADSERTCFVVRASRIMELLHGNEAMREDFLNGSNGACVVSKLELDQLVNFYELFIMKSYDTGANILEDAKKAGEHMYELAGGRSKDIIGTTYKDLNSVIGRISDCKYFEELRDTNQALSMHSATDQNEAASVSSESTAEEDVGEKQDVDEQNDEPESQEGNAIENEVLSPNSTDPVSSPSGFSGDIPLKTEEFLRSSNGAQHVPQTETWQQPSQKPDTGTYMSQDVGFQHSMTDSRQMMQRAYEAQRIQEVLAEVQGPCQFLQESIIDREVVSAPSVMTFAGIDIHQPSLTAPHPVAQSITAPTHLHASALESVFQSSQNISPIDQAMLTSQVASIQLPKESTTVHQEHLAVDQPPNESETYTPNQNLSYMPIATTASQPNIEYPLDNSSRQQPDNLGLGQTTFGGQQQESHVTFMSNNEQNSYSQDEAHNPNSAFNSVSASHSITQSSEIQNLMQQTPSEPPVPPIPLPNEQQSGYRSFQGDENQNASSQNIQTSEHGLGGNKDQTSVDEKDNSDHVHDVRGSPQQVESGTMQQGGDQTNYNPRNAPHQHHSGPQHSGRGRGGYGSGYRSGPGGNQGGNYHSQRYNNNNFRGRYNGGYDNMGRPGNNYSGGYQGNQSGNGYRHQDNFNYRRGGGMRGGRGNGRGNPRGGGGNYNRSRTFRPQHASEQAA